MDALSMEAYWGQVRSHWDIKELVAQAKGELDGWSVGLSRRRYKGELDGRSEGAGSGMNNRGVVHGVCKSRLTSG